VWLEYDAERRDRYGRLLAYVWTEVPDRRDDAEIRRKMFNARLALDGIAQQMTIPPDVRYAEYFREYVAEARSAEKGLWAQP
jgi:micrococcal nuclease